MYHRVLQRQMTRLGVGADRLPEDPALWTQFLARIDRFYREVDQDRYLLERSLSISSREMQALYDRLRETSESRIAAERNRLRAVISSLGAGLCTLDEQGRVVSINPEGERLLGWAEEALAGQLFFAAMTGGLETPHADGVCAFTDMLATGQPCRQDGSFLRKDGTRLPVSYTLNPIVEDGVLQGAVLVFFDISARVQAASALSASEERYRTLLNQLPVGVYRTTPDGRFIQANPAMAALFGVESVEALRQVRAQDLFLEADDRGQYVAQLMAAGTITTEFAMKRLDGEVIWVRDFARAIQDGPDAAAYFDGILVDITARKKAAEALRESEARSRALLAAVPDLMFRLSRDGTILAFKAEEGDLLMAADAIVGMNLADLPKPSELIENLTRCLERAVTTGAMQLYEYELALPKGLQMFEARIVRCGDDEALCIVRNISERRQAERRLRLLEASVSASLDGITISDAQTADHPLVYVSPGFERMTGYDAEEILGRNCRLLQGEDRDQPALETVKRALHTGMQCRVVLRNYRKDGTLFWNELTLYPLHDAAGRLTHYVGIQRDVTERKQAEQELARINTELEHRNRELQDFAYVASHDLQEPLRKIHAFADLMQEDYQDKVDETGTYYLHRMQDAAARMSGLINDLLAYSRVTIATRPFDTVDLNAVMADVLLDLEVRIEETGGHVTVTDLPTIKADATQMRQLLQNFVGNALKFHRPDVPPIVEIVGTLEAAPTPEGGPLGERCRLEVRDNGIGFDEKYRDRIFTPFQRLHGRGRYAGTGMGLAICRRIVERHQGTITAHSMPGEGATFVVLLPLHQASAPADTSAV